MGLAASQCRLMLLTAKNNALELSAMNIEQERLLLAQEQETIAQEYSDKTSNQIYTCSVLNEDGSTSQESLSLSSLLKSQNPTGTEGNVVGIANSSGEAICYAQYVDGKICYYDADGNSIDENSTIAAFNSEGYGNVLQQGLQNGTYQLLVSATEDTANANATTLYNSVDGDEVYMVRKSTDSLSGVTSRYYTEDDAAAQAEYTSAMARVNALDTKLENKLNQVETQKTAVEQELESVDSIIQSNVERTFQYFS